METAAPPPSRTDELQHGKKQQLRKEEDEQEPQNAVVEIQGKGVVQKPFPALPKPKANQIPCDTPELKEAERDQKRSDFRRHKSFPRLRIRGGVPDQEAADDKKRLHVEIIGKLAYKTALKDVRDDDQND